MGTLSIPLTQGKFAVIDADDYPLIAGYSWHATREWNTWYARAPILLPNGNHSIVRMHRLILGAAPDVFVDHRDGDGLVNTRANIRQCSNSQNQQNRVHLTTNTSGYRGITWNKSARRWQAAIKYQSKSYYLGVFVTAADAACAYDAKARELFGEFARLNFPTGNEVAA